jgi:phenylalanyl-tRNA synthetase beta chain
VLAAVLGAPTQGLLRSARLFDVYRPSAASAAMALHERSLAIRLELLDDDAPLTDARSDEVVKAVVDAASQQVGARLRGA